MRVKDLTQDMMHKTFKSDYKSWSTPVWQCWHGHGVKFKNAFNFRYWAAGKIKTSIVSRWRKRCT